ncbi:MAG: hypothetical protein AAFX78_10115 [Cyanobacteria bacterium J06638_20]
MDMKYIFEVRDITDDEIYFVVGYYSSLDKVKEAFEKSGSKEAISENNDGEDYEEIAVYRHPVDPVPDHHRSKLMITLQREFDESIEEWGSKLTEHY